MSLGIQRKIGFGTVLDVSHVGTLGRHLSDYIALNTVAPGAHFLASSQSPIGGILPDNFMRPFPGYGTINLETYGLISSYHSLQAQVTRQRTSSPAEATPPVPFLLAIPWRTRRARSRNGSTRDAFTVPSRGLGQCTPCAGGRSRNRRLGDRPVQKRRPIRDTCSLLYA